MEIKQNSFEQDFAAQVSRYRLPVPVRNFRFAADELGRQWHADFAWPEFKLGVELDGLIIEKVRRPGAKFPMAVDTGSHGTVAGRIRDMDKGNAAVLIGWALLHFCQKHVACTDAIAMTQRALAARGWNPRLRP
jgi:hypothetical protein